MHFSGDVITKWLKHGGDDRHMELMDEFVFEDDEGIRWIANVGDTINGASIPQFVWSTVGSPFIGDYRRASVLHDVECDRKTSPHKDVHRMFYDAMICDGVATLRAKFMYKAVRIFGPKWGRAGFQTKSLSGIDQVDLGLLNQDLDLDIDTLEKKLDKMLDEE